MPFTFQPMPHTEARDRIAKLPLVTREVMDGMLPELRAYAFCITGLDVGDQLSKVRDQIAAVPAGEKTWDKAKKEIAAELSGALGGKEGQRRAEILLRTHVFRGYAAARYRSLLEQADIFPFWEYKTYGDGNVRPSHAALNRKIFPAGHDIWQRIFPPWDWGCRCLVVPLTKGAVERMQTGGMAAPVNDGSLLPTQISKPEIYTTRESDLIATAQKLPDGTPLNHAPTWASAPWSIPGNIRHDWPLIQKRYAHDPEALDAFEKWAKKQMMPGQKKSVWTWIAGRAKPVKRIVTDAFPEGVDGLRVVKGLGGSTGAQLVTDSAGNRFVMKKGASAEHLREEVFADQIYRDLGLPVPEARLYETASGPVKLTRFIEGRSLKDALATATPEAKEALLKQIREGFVADAWLGNWDVVGLGMDNILVDAAGTAWRIDNGGALRFRAMGKAKTAAQWNERVEELESMLDAGRNETTARIFAGISESDMKRQFDLLQSRLEAALGSAPNEIAEMLRRRMAWLDEKFNPGVFSEAFAGEVRQAGVIGKTHLGDRDLIEDTTVLVWEEKDVDGNPVTRIKARLTEKGSDAMVDALGDSLAKVRPLAASGKRVLPGDSFWGPLETTIKHINHHAKDGIYNPAKTAVLDTLEAQLTALIPASAEESAMVAHYQGIITQAKTAVAAKKTTPFFNQYEPPEPQIRGRRSAFEVKSSSLEWKKKRKDRGFAQQEVGNVFQQQAYQIRHEDTEMHFIPWKEPSGIPSSALYAFRGYVEMSIPGPASATSLKKAAAFLKEAGVDIAKVTPAYQELVYLSKGLNIRDMKLTPAKRQYWRDILDDASLSDEEKVSKLKLWAPKHVPGVDFSSPSYRPQGITGSKDLGWHKWERWDLPRVEIERDLAGYTLTHQTSGKMADVVESILQGGGQFTSTTERLRTGVSIGDGMSPMSDMQSGGANYLFTRIKPTSAAPANTLCFKVGNLARMDALSFDEDRYGDVRPVGQTSRSDYRKKRAVTTDDFKAHSRAGSNETIFKWGLNLLDDLDFIRCRSEAEKKAVLAVFKKHKITQLPDGRAITDIVKS